MNYKKYHRDKTYQENESHFKNIFMTRFRIANYFVKVGTSKKVLDIGASTGIMLDIFKEHGWETWGVEPSISALRAKNKKHKILKTYFEKVRLPENYLDRKSTRLNSSHQIISYAVFCLKKKKKTTLKRYTYRRCYCD